MSITTARGEDVIVLYRMPYIHYPIQFQKRGKEVIRALIDSGSKLNAMIPSYTKELSLQI